MPNNVIMRRIEVTADYRPLSDMRLVGTVEISTPPTNSGPVFFRGGEGEAVEFRPAEWHQFRSVNLAEIFVRGEPGDVVTIIGGTWRD